MRNIGHYEVLGVIGDGGMGTVYKARDPRFDRLVAVKVLHPHFQREAGIVERFKTEAVVQAKLQHPHIVAVHDFIADDQTLAIVMEFVEGRPLDRLIEQTSGPLPTALAIEIMGQTLLAIAYAHGKGLVHRDLKPSNILVQESDGERLVKVTDFGIAKVLGNEKLRTATGAKMGTLGYMSPEHIRSPKNVDHRADIYALGATLYEMLSGELPHRADSEYDLMQQILTAPTPRLAIRGVAPALDDVVQTATAKDRGARFPDCLAFRTALLAASALSHPPPSRVPTRMAGPPPPPPPPMPASAAFASSGAPAVTVTAGSQPAAASSRKALRWGLVLMLLGLGIPSLLAIPVRLLMLGGGETVFPLYRALQPARQVALYGGLLCVIVGRALASRGLRAGAPRQWMVGAAGAEVLRLLVHLGSGPWGFSSTFYVAGYALATLAVATLVRPSRKVSLIRGLPLAALVALAAVAVVVLAVPSSLSIGRPSTVLYVLTDTTFDALFLVLSFSAFGRVRAGDEGAEWRRAATRSR